MFTSNWDHLKKSVLKNVGVLFLGKKRKKKSSLQWLHELEFSESVNFYFYAFINDFYSL